MHRRSFIHQLSLLGAGSAFAPAWLNTASLRSSNSTFNLHYAPHLGMFEPLVGEDPLDQLRFMADQGFTAFEDNGMKERPVAMQRQMAQVMEERGLRMGVFVAHEIYWDKPNLASGDEGMRTEFLTQIEESIEVAKRVNAKWMTVVPGYLDLRLNQAYQTAHVVDSLKFACELLEPHGLVMVLEPLNFRDHPGMFLTKSPQAYHICKSVNSPACKILFDVYHQQIQEGNLIPNITSCWDEIGYFQVGDNPGRKEPTTGEINFRTIFKFIYDQGYDGIIGMEHGNFGKGRAGAERVIEAYREVDGF